MDGESASSSSSYSPVKRKLTPTSSAASATNITLQQFANSVFTPLETPKHVPFPHSPHSPHPPNCPQTSSYRRPMRPTMQPAATASLESALNIINNQQHNNAALVSQLREQQLLIFNLQQQLFSAHQFINQQQLQNNIQRHMQQAQGLIDQSLKHSAGHTQERNPHMPTNVQQPGGHVPNPSAQERNTHTSTNVQQVGGQVRNPNTHERNPHNPTNAQQPAGLVRNPNTQERNPSASNNAQSRVQHIRKNVAIIGDSMLNEIKQSEMRYKHNVLIRNHPGATSEDIIHHVRAHARKKPNAIIITVGHNDITENRNPANENIDTCDNLRKAIREVRQQLPECHISICELTVRRDLNGISKQVNDLNQKLQQLAQREHIGYVRTNTFQLDHLGRHGLHPNGWGKQKLRDILKNYVATL